MYRTILTGGWLAAVVCVFLPTAARAQLEQTSWDERIAFLAPGQQERLGLDMSLPEPLADSTQISGWAFAEKLEYGPPGPPQICAYAAGYHVGAPNLTRAQALGRGVISFQLAVRSTGTPPVPVSFVPVIIHAKGSTGGRSSVRFCYPPFGCAYDAVLSAYAVITIESSSASLVNESIASAGGRNTLDYSEIFPIAPDDVLNGSVEVVVTASLNNARIGAWGQSKASIEPGFEISPALIPGSESKYADFFQIEYSPGYWALGNPTPVTSTTWGKIKTLYSNHR